MSKIRKRFQKILNNPVGIKWNELTVILDHYGCKIEKGSKGSHWVVFHSDDLEKNITVVVHNNRVKPVYVKRVIGLLEDVLDENEQ